MKSAEKAPRSIAELDARITRPTENVLAAIDACAGEFLVLGAAGKMGFHVTRMLQRSLQELGRRDGVTAVSRFASPDSRLPFDRCGVTVVAADLSDADRLAKVPPAENVFYLAGIKFGTCGSADLLKRMNVTMPELVASRFCDSRIVALSTGCVYSFTTPSSGGSTEESPTEPPGDYARSCLDREQAFIAGSRARGTRCVLVRLNYSNDLRYGVLVDIAQQVIAGTAIDLATGYVNVIWQGDAISHIIQSLPHADSPPLIINVTGSETLRVREIAERFGARIGRAPSFRGSEAPTCWLNNNSFARKLFGDPMISVDCMIDWIADWLVRGGETLGKPTQFQIRDGNY